MGIVSCTIGSSMKSMKTCAFYWCGEVHWLCWNRWNEAFSELHRFFVDARAAPAIWISGLALDDEIPATPALPGDFRLPVSEAMKETAWNDRFNDLGIPGLCVFWGNTETLSQAWLLGLARCLGLPYGMLGRHSQSQLDNLTQCRIIGSTWIHLAPVYTKVLLRECAWRFDPRLVSKARCDQLTVLTMTTVLCFPNLQSSFHLFSEQVWEVSISHTSTWARRLSAVRCCQMLSDAVRCAAVPPSCYSDSKVYTEMFPRQALRKLDSCRQNDCRGIGATSKIHERSLKIHSYWVFDRPSDTSFPRCQKYFESGREPRMWGVFLAVTTSLMVSFSWQRVEILRLVFSQASWLNDARRPKVVHKVTLSHPSQHGALTRICSSRHLATHLEAKLIHALRRSPVRTECVRPEPIQWEQRNMKII